MKWKIQRNVDNAEEINKYLNKIDAGYTSENGWAYSEKIRAGNLYPYVAANGKPLPKNHDSFTTITIEEFRAITSGKPIGANYLIYN